MIEGNCKIKIYYVITLKIALHFDIESGNLIYLVKEDNKRIFRTISVAPRTNFLENFSHMSDSAAVSP